MKSGISLVEMAKEIQRQAELKADYMMDTRSLRLEPFGSDLYLNAYTPSGEMAVEPLEINAIAHRQIGTHLKIPAAYYDKMLTQHPQLLSENVNAWFEREPAVRLVRTIGGTARAFLSNRYRRIDNLDIAGIVLPVLQDMEGMHFESCQLTESRIFDMFLQELENHEYSYTGDVQEALDALGITPQYMEAMPQLMTGLSLACNKAMQHDCFGRFSVSIMDGL